MLAVQDKTLTLRSAVAEAWVVMETEVARRIQADDLPKKQVLATARVAGLMGAKRTPDLIPDCHPLPLDEVDLRFEWAARGLRIEAKAVAIARTGVEMEAYTAAAAAALTVVDMAKCLDRPLSIEGLRLLEKRGGKHSFSERPPAGYRAAVLVTSDKCSAGEREDKTGPWLKARLEEAGIQAVEYRLLPDDRERIRAYLEEGCARGLDLILSTGGTGLSPRDVTVEAVQSLGGREVPGMMEAVRGHGQARTPRAMLSRGVAVQKGRSLIITLPGSSAGCREGWAVLFPHLFHAHGIMQGGGH